VYPSSKSPRPLTALQQHLLKKLGPDAHALTVSVSGHAPHSVGLKPARAYGGSPLGVTYDLKVFPGYGVWIVSREHNLSSKGFSLTLFKFKLRRSSRLQGKTDAIVAKCSEGAPDSIIVWY
ncbi:arrestin, partial [Nephila pilipes]